MKNTSCYTDFVHRTHSVNLTLQRICSSKNILRVILLRQRREVWNLMVLEKYRTVMAHNLLDITCVLHKP